MLEECSVCSNYFTFSSISQASKTWKYDNSILFGVCGGVVWYFFVVIFFFFKEKDTRKDGRLQYVVKEESSPLKRQQDFGQEILISKHVRTQTDTEPRDAISLGILPFTDL